MGLDSTAVAVLCGGLLVCALSGDWERWRTADRRIARRGLPLAALVALLAVAPALGNAAGVQVERPSNESPPR